MRTCVDLFSGVGGFALALSDMYRPLLYCDISDHAVAVLTSRMNDGALHPAPIVRDVRETQELSRVVNGRHVHLLTSGWPCVGWSVSGARAGLSNPHTGLFSKVVDAIAALRPDMLFFENVPAILSACGGKDFEVVSRSIADMGYDLDWTIISAGEAGAPQLRKRWFCLGVRRDLAAESLPDLPQSDQGVACASWDTDVPAIVCKHLSGNTRRYFMLGNAVVPMQARIAFKTLLARKKAPESAVLCRAIKPRAGTQISVHAKSGRMVRGADGLPVEYLVIWEAENEYKRSPCEICITLDPTWRTLTKSAKIRKRSLRHGTPPTPVVDILQRTVLPTPRSHCATPSRILNRRTLGDLASIAVFACRVNGVDQQRTDETDGVNPQFVEWLMGFAPGWTSPNPEVVSEI